MNFRQFGGFGTQFCPKKWVSPTFQPDRQVNPEDRPSKDSKTAAVSDFAKIGRSPPSRPPSSFIYIKAFPQNFSFLILEIFDLFAREVC